MELEPVAWINKYQLNALTSEHGYRSGYGKQYLANSMKTSEDEVPLYSAATVEQLVRERDDLKQNIQDMNAYMHKRIEEAIKDRDILRQKAIELGLENSHMHHQTNKLAQEILMLRDCHE